MNTLFQAFMPALSVLSTLLPFAVLGTMAYFARRLIIALEHRTHVNAESAELRARVAHLENAHAAMERDLVRLQAGQELVYHALTARGTPSLHGTAPAKNVAGR